MDESTIKQIEDNFGMDDDQVFIFETALLELARLVVMQKPGGEHNTFDCDALAHTGKIRMNWHRDASFKDVSFNIKIEGHKEE